MKFLPRDFFWTINLKKVPLKGIVLLILAGTLIFGGIFVYEELTTLPPYEAVVHGITQSMQAPNFRYQSVAKRFLDGQEMIISEIWGERSAQGVHLKGNLPIIEAEVEIYQINDKMYRRDPLTEGWLVVSANGRASMEQLITELNPMGVFNVTGEIEVRYSGTEKVEGTSCRIYEVMSKGENKYVELYWQDFNYRLWIGKRDGYLHKAEIAAEHRDNSLHTLTVDINFSDYNKSIEIQAPVE